ncbi:UDP-glucose dehydrogenase family protein [Tepidibacter formicigenes]|uniref:UDP-glucose 6-dehydrogenase n=1 Tax=Tepidibacter formicigenes DSM 15518 TaxID=1123349 RepID=A0A1M6N198_9FIRM|nr:UDP-glucose/GDP-mannose dehydrogenase family protein [Tepidibacter formicigenes]SHJ89428.1 UDPglucose 6-dehydrogenase [Tepidibacter formicigenes DSM 15518]
MNICVIGGGYVGLITSVVFSKMGNKVICVEKNIEKIKKLNKGIPTIFEEGLNELLNKSLNSKSILFTDNLKEGVNKSDVIFIAVGTPSTKDGNVDMSQITNVINEISSFINEYKVIVNKSTVPVGSQKYVKKLLIENGVNPKNFDVVSNPEFLREGKAIYDFLHGDRIVIGHDSEKAKDIIKKLYEPFKIVTIFTTPETAELIKYASNAFLSTKISFINEIANLCNKVGADIDTISYALGLDKRISPQFLKPGIGFGGSCFPKDTIGLVKIGERYGSDFKIVKSAIKVNEYQRILPVKVLLDEYKDIKGKIISILGLTFKSETDDIRESPSLYIIEELLKKGAVIKAYDPMASNEIKKLFPDIQYFDNLYDTLLDSSSMIICTDWKEFSNIDLEVVKKKMKNPFIIDGRNVLDIKKVEKNNINYYSIGKGYIKGC